MTKPTAPGPPRVRLVLASTSPARLATLRAAGVEPSVLASEVDEEALEAQARTRYGPLEPADVALLLARAKCEAVASGRTSLVAAGRTSLVAAGRTSLVAAGRTSLVAAGRTSRRVEPGTAWGDAPVVVLGCDSLLELDGQVYGKPTDAADAVRRWHRMRGRTGILHTGHWLRDERHFAAGGTGATLGATASTAVHFARLSDAEVEAYVATGEPLAVAGAFTVDGLGGAFVTGIEGDHHNVVGLSLPLLRDLLGQVGLGWFDIAG